MFNKSRIALALAITLGTASAALAGTEKDDNSYGGPVQTWQDIEHARQEIQRQIQSEYHTSNPGTAYGYAASPSQQKDLAQSRKKLINH